MLLFWYLFMHGFCHVSHFPNEMVPFSVNHINTYGSKIQCMDTCCLSSFKFFYLVPNLCKYNMDCAHTISLLLRSIIFIYCQQNILIVNC